MPFYKDQILEILLMTWGAKNLAMLVKRWVYLRRQIENLSYNQSWNVEDNSCHCLFIDFSDCCEINFQMLQKGSVKTTDLPVGAVMT